MSPGWGQGSESLYAFAVGSFNAANWPNGTGLDGVIIQMYRPGILRPSSRPLDKMHMGFVAPAPDPEHEYRESFPALDVEVIVVLLTEDSAIRRAGALAVHDALAGLRSADATARSR
jgi:hypothetical protein